MNDSYLKATDVLGELPCFFIVLQPFFKGREQRRGGPEQMFLSWVFCIVAVGEHKAGRQHEGTGETRKNFRDFGFQELNLLAILVYVRFACEYIIPQTRPVDTVTADADVGYDDCCPRISGKPKALRKDEM